MNFYFLLEDEKSFLKVLPSWLQYAGFGCTRVADIQEIREILFDIVILVSNHCFETWLLGCTELYPVEGVDETSGFYPYYCRYNTGVSDPEDLSPPEGCRDTTAKYHFHYLSELLRYKKIRYSKNRPSYVAAENYFFGIVKRIQTTEHLKSFKAFYSFISHIKVINERGKG